MKLYRVVPRHVEERRQSVGANCDRCGQRVDSVEPYGADEIHIRADLGEIYPEGDTRESYGVDCCKSCWISAVVPALKAAGFRIREWRTDENEPAEEIL